MALLVLSACERPTFEAGSSCELNSDCDSPLVCRLGRCRSECRGSRDCSVGLLCLRDEDGLGACQVQSECDEDDDCPRSLVCAMSVCTNACREDDDCPAGATCAVLDSGARGCVDPSDTGCDLNSACAPGLLCAPDRRCREPCRADRDCRDGRQCLQMGGMAVCGFPLPDAGLDGGVDGGVDAGTDGGVLPEPPSVGLLSGGTGHTCLATAGQGVRCWGTWVNTTTDLELFSRASPTAFDLGGADADALMAGGSHDCVLVGGELRCWGDNSSAQLARDPGTLSFSETPLTITLRAPVRALGPGLHHTCVVLEDGTVWCWGTNDSGQLGHAGSGPTPAEVTGLPLPAIDVAARSQNSCALLLDGSVWCWGANDFGQLGTGTTSASVSPVAIVGLGPAAEIDVGTNFACARLETGAIQCWGGNDGGQLAMGAGGESPTPVTIPLPMDAAEIEAGVAHACARLVDDSVHCWGLNATRQAGAATGLYVITPLAVSSGLELTTGEIHSCVRTGSSAVSCWGGNQGGQLGHGGGSTATPMAVPGL